MESDKEGGGQTSWLTEVYAGSRLSASLPGALCKLASDYSSQSRGTCRIPPGYLDWLPGPQSGRGIDPEPRIVHTLNLRSSI